MNAHTQRRGGEAISLGDAIGELFGEDRGSRGQKYRPTGSRVHRYTKTQAGQEGRFWAPFPARNKARLLQVAQRYDLTGRLAARRDRTGRKNGHLGHVALDVLRELLHFIDYKTGQLDPAIATIAARIGRSIAAVAEALKRLRDHGFLEWIRRYVPTGNDGLRGPQVKQTSNAYRLTLPKALLRDLDSPPPDDDTQRRETAKADAAAMLAALPLDEQPGEMIAHRGLAEALARLARGVMERDSDQQNESRQQIDSNGLA